MTTPRIAARCLILSVSATSVLCLADTDAALAQLSIARSVIAGGGGGGTGGAFALGGTAGQPAAGPISGGSFTLSAGFWAGGGGVAASVDSDDADGPLAPAATPLAFRVYPVSPNPMQRSMVLTFDLPEPSVVHAQVYDAGGRLVRVLADGVVPAGHNARTWDRRDAAGAPVPAGIYFLRFEAGAQRARQKLVVVH